MPPPSRAGYAALGPYAKARLTVHALGLSLPLDVPVDVFSTQRIDEGTQLLLAHLPERPPASVLEIGCGYGALGLPVCARFPDAKALLLDRDLLAVAACAHNARQLQLGHATVVPGLGYRDVPREARWDWILCNVPARIGPLFVRHLLVAGRALLAPGGELRIVVIRDLEPLVQAAAVEGVRLVVRGPRHSVYSLSHAAGLALPPLDDDALYARDQTSLGELRLERPHDASEDPRHALGLQLLLDALPKAAPKRAFAFRCGYGALPAALCARYPEAQVAGQERDLLDAAFARRNAPRAQIVEAIFVADALARLDGQPDLIVGEWSASAGQAASARELKEAIAGLSPQGQALVLLTARQEREWLPAAFPPSARGSVLLRRDDFSLLRLTNVTRP